jgi:hypothetical protein
VAHPPAAADAWIEGGCPNRWPADHRDTRAAIRLGDLLLSLVRWGAYGDGVRQVFWIHTGRPAFALLTVLHAIKRSRMACRARIRIGSATVPEAEKTSVPKNRRYQSAAETLMRPATDRTLRGAANQIAMAEITLSPIDKENAGR